MATGLSCTECRELLALAALGVLDAAEGPTVEEHIATCHDCRVEGRDLQRTVALLPVSLEPMQPPASLRRAVLKEVYGAERHRQRPAIWAALWSRVPQGRPLTVAGALALVAAVVLAVWGATRPAAAPTVSYAVVGTTTEPHVSGTLTYFRQNADAVITVNGLPDPTTTRSGRPSAYELWLIAGSGSPQPAGFLSRSPLTQTWAGVIDADLAHYQMVAATAEPVGGSPQPTGPQIFSVRLEG